MKYRISDQVLLQEMDDEIVLLDMKSGRYFGLDPVGGRAWELLAETGDSEAVIAGLLAEYEVDEATLRQDIDELLEQFLGAGLVMKTDG